VNEKRARTADSRAVGGEGVLKDRGLGWRKETIDMLAGRMGSLCTVRLSQRIRRHTRSMAAPRMKTRFWFEIVEGEVKKK
jgi:hypothetical protein